MHLYLCNAEITVEAGEALYSDNAIECVITVMDGTENTVENGGDDVNAIHIKGNLSINGETYVISSLDDGIAADRLTKINGGEITIENSREGIEGAYVEITGGT